MDYMTTIEFECEDCNNILFLSLTPKERSDYVQCAVCEAFWKISHTATIKRVNEIPANELDKLEEALTRTSGDDEE